MPADNADPIASGADIAFPNNGPILNTNIGRVSDSSFSLNTQGTFFVIFRAAVNESAQLVLTLNDIEIEYTLSGRNAQNSEIVGTAIITTNTDASTLTVRNPEANAAEITLTPYAGGSLPVSAHLTIIQIA